MHPRPRHGGYLLAAALTAALLPAGTAEAATATPDHPPAARPVQADRTITLVTGDRLAVSTDGAQRVTALPSPGRTGTRFVSQTVKGHLQVVPEDALPMLTAGTLDPRLFDVTQLLADGFGDEKRSTLPLIVSTGGKSLTGIASARNVRELRSVGAQALTQDRSSAATMWKSLTTPARGLRAGVTRISLDGYLHVSLDTSVPQIGAPTAWAAGYTGAGISVGVVDTGVDVTHPDLKDAVAENKSFLDVSGGPGGPPGPPAPPGPPEDDKDYAGHGTHVASTIAGRGTASDGKYKGVAPAAKIYSAKVCNRFGQCPESATLAGMQWAAEKRLRVVNMSLGHPNAPGMDIMEEAVQSLTAQYGTLFVVASGNDAGPASAPSTAPDALSVGAVDKQDNIASFSNGGSIFGELAAKPEVTAPGVAITAAQSTTKQPTDGKPYWSASGTSMATPHVVGAVALLAQQHPEWTAAQLKSSLVSSAKPNDKTPVFRQGAGRVDLTRAIAQNVLAAPASLSFGEHDWPHEDNKPVSNTITYSNSGTAPITLAVSSAVTGPDGEPAAAGLVSVNPASVTVPAGGTADVTVTVSPSVKTPDGYFGGTVVASGGDTAVRTPWVMYKDIEAYNVTITNLDRKGNAPAQVRTQFYAQDGSNWGGLNVVGGVAKARLPKGSYTLSTQLREGSGDTAELTSLVAAKVNVDRDTSITMDGRVAKPLSVTVPENNATQYFGHVHHAISFGGVWALGEDLTGPNFDRMYTGQIGPDDEKNIVTSVSGAWAKQDADGSIDGSPYLYNLAWHKHGGYVTGFQRKVAKRDLASVDAMFASELKGSQGGVITERREVGAGPLGWSVYAGIKALPAHRTMYYNADGDTEFRTQFNSGAIVDGTPKGLSYRQNPFTAYKAGATTSERWNYGVYSPAFPVQQADTGFFSRPVEISRTGNRIMFWPSLISDSGSQTADATTDGTVTVTRNGEPFFTDEFVTTAFNAPADEATYRATAEVTRPAPAELATRVTTSWTFRSGTTPATQALPVAAIRFSPALNQNNIAPFSTAPFALPVTVQPQPGSAVGATTALTVEVSFDDGTTWAPANVTGEGDQRLAAVVHPKGHGFVSLRAKATSAGINTVEQTIVRAYKY